MASLFLYIGGIGVDPQEMELLFELTPRVEISYVPPEEPPSWNSSLKNMSSS